LVPILKLDELESLDINLTQRVLLAYFRILTANRLLPSQLCWPLSPLSKLIWRSGLDNGVRLLAIQCYAAQAGMVEPERIKIEKELFGEPCAVDCDFYYGETLEGERKMMDGWVMPLVESERVQEHRKRIATEVEDFYAHDESEVVNVLSEDMLWYVHDLKLTGRIRV
jgi:midasin